MDEGINLVTGVIRELDGQEAIVEVEQGGCGRCHEKGGCGGQHLSQMFCSQIKTYRVANPNGVAVGEKVLIGISSGSIRRSANLAYGLPLLGLVIGALIGMNVAGDPGAMLGGGIGLFVAWLLLRQKIDARSGNWEVRPYIISRFHS